MYGPYGYGKHFYDYGYAPRYGSHTYGQIGGPDGYLARCMTFAGKSLWGGWEGDLYVVYSYDTRIAQYDRTTGERIVDDLSNYSRTTRRHQTLVAAWLATALAREAAPATIARALAA